MKLTTTITEPGKSQPQLVFNRRSLFNMYRCVSGVVVVVVVVCLCSVIRKKVYSLCQLVRQSQLVQSTCVLCTHNRNSAYNTYDQNSYFGMSVDFVVVGT